MSSRPGCRRGFRREPDPWWDGPPPPPPPAYGPQDEWREPPWKERPRRGRGRWHPCGPQDPRPFPGYADFTSDDLPLQCGPQDPRPFPGYIDFTSDDLPLQCGPQDPRPFPGHADFPWNEEDGRWAPHDCPPPPSWNDSEDNQGPEDFFREDWYLEPDPDYINWADFPPEEQHPPWPPPHPARERGGFQDGRWPRGYRGRGGRRPQRLHRGRRELTVVQRSLCPQPPRGKHPSSRSSSSCSGKSPLRIKEEPQHPDPPKPLTSCKASVQSKEQTTQDPPAAGGKVPGPPKAADTPQKSLTTDPQAATEAAEPEQAGATLVEPGVRQKPAGSQSQSPSALETEPALLEESSAGSEKHLEVEPCSPSVPKAGTDAGSHPHGPTAPPEPSETRMCTVASSAGEVPPEATTEPDAQPSKACLDTCTVPETSPGTQPPPGSSETEPAAGEQHQLSSTLLTLSPARTDLRSAAVLARKEEIELSYQQFSLTIAVVATMLLQKEPSMEAPLGLALRANLRQGRIHLLQELEDFINSYDSATLSH